MPFTVAHAAAAFPLRRATSLPLCGLAVGTMSPDLEYFFRGRPGRTIGHETWGVILMDLPLALLCLATASWFMVPGLAALLPRRWAHLRPPLRAWSAPLRPGSGLGRLCLAIVVGAFSHILWDDFTHTTDAVGLRWLNWPVMQLGDRDGMVRVHDLLQVGSSVVGLGVLAVAASRWLREQPPTIPVVLPKRHRAVVATLVFSTVIALAMLNPFQHALASTSRYQFVVLAVVGAATLALATLTLFGVLLRTTGLDELVSANELEDERGLVDLGRLARQEKP